LNRPAVHDHAITVEAPSWLRASSRERASGVPARTQSAGIGAGASSTWAGGAMTIGGDIEGSGLCEPGRLGERGE
jgi:hypothetical protein